jgi:hypothetical protein
MAADHVLVRAAPEHDQADLAEQLEVRAVPAVVAAGARARIERRAIVHR